MIVRTIDDLKGTPGDMRVGHLHTLRFLHQHDGMGFTLTDTLVRKGSNRTNWYKHHLEACYCIDGEGSIEDLATGTVYDIRPGTIYALNKNDRHRLSAHTDMRLICVFNPPLKGGEIHDDDGSYPSSA